jgi:hypothetical protein
MQARVIVLVPLNKIEQAAKGALGLHHVKGGFIAASVVEQYGRDNVQQRSMFLLKRSCQQLLALVYHAKGRGRTCNRQ